MVELATKKEIEQSFKDVDQRFKDVEQKFDRMELRFDEVILQIRALREEVRGRPLKDFLRMFGAAVSMVTFIGGLLVIYQFLVN